MNMSVQSRKKQGGFTLIEIAIVLVIIGLLLGGVLQGQQLIENSRVKSATNDFNGIAAAAFSYQDRYGRFPGDDGPQTTLEARGGAWANLPDSTAGNTNGRVEASVDDAFDGDGEGAFFFSHLRAAGFITGDPTQPPGSAAILPQNPFGGLIGIVGATIYTNMAGTKICMSNVPGSAGIALDTQLDDGSPDTGRFRAEADSATFTGTTAATVYDENLTYIVCNRF